MPDPQRCFEFCTVNYRICRNHIWIVDSAGVLKNAGTGKVTSYEEQANNVHTLYSAIDQD
jgi:hypothetical protein